MPLSLTQENYLKLKWYRYTGSYPSKQKKKSFQLQNLTIAKQIYVFHHEVPIKSF